MKNLLFFFVFLFFSFVSVQSYGQLGPLQTIANQCPLQHGQAIYRARSLYALIDYATYEDACALPAARMSQDTCWSDVVFMNPSLEGTPQPGAVPSDWTKCSESPDINPLDSTRTAASDGNTYVLLAGVKLDNIYKEAIGQELNENLIAGETYKFNVDLSYMTWWNGTPATLSFSIGNDICQQEQQIFYAEISNPTWETYEVSFVPNKDYRYFVISGEAPLQHYSAAALVDNLRSIPCQRDTTPPQSEEEDYFNIYPNPNTNGDLNVEWDKNYGATDMVLVDALGRVVGKYATTPNNNIQQIDVKYLASGVYIVLLQNKRKVIARAKLIIGK